MTIFSQIGLKIKLGKDRSQLSRKPAKLKKRNSEFTPSDQQDGVNELGEREHSIWSDASTLIGNRDHTDMIHGLAHHDSFDSLIDGIRSNSVGGGDERLDRAQLKRKYERSEKNKKLLGSLSGDLWQRIAALLDPADAAHLTITSRLFLEKLGNGSLRKLERPENKVHRVQFLNHMDAQMPNHLLCHPCGVYHLRTSAGDEKPRVDFVRNPPFICPKATTSYLPRMRLVHGRELPYYLIQLAIRHSAHSTRHGIHSDILCRRWKDKSSGWSHQSLYMIHDKRLLLRLRSQIFAPPKLTPTAERMLLYEQQEYTPFFSVCAHWRDGELMRLVKCALSHVPEAPESLINQMRKSPRAQDWIVKPNLIARQCDECRPARRCPECPTEYLIEISIREDPKDALNRFKHVLVVTRWSDLGDGTSPTSSPEYCAINGLKADYNSFNSVGRRAVAGVFESRMSGSIPGQRMISLNPKNQHAGEEGYGWY